MKFFSSLMLKNFSSHLTWELSWTPSHKWSSLFQWTWTRLNFPLQKGLPYCTVGYETWFTGATLIEIGVSVAALYINTLYINTAVSLSYGHLFRVLRVSSYESFHCNSNCCDLCKFWVVYLCIYSQLFLSRTPLGPVLSVRLREMSVL